jgi:hypothetical protein
MREFEENLKDTKALEKSDGTNHLNLLDVHKQHDNLQLNKTDLLHSGDPMAALPLNHYLTIRDRQEDNQSYFKTGVTFLTRAGRHLVGAADATAKFEEARKSGNAAAMVNLQHADHDQRKLEHRIGAYSGAALKTALLFADNKIGYAGLAVVSTADEAKPGDPFERQAVDAALGAAKGLATRFVFNKINEQPWNPVAKGWTLGMSNRLIDVGLTSDNYINADGQIDMKAGGLKTLASVFSAKSLIVDAGTGLASSLVLLPIDAYTSGAFLKNAAAAKLTIAGVSGLTEGSLIELNHQQDNPKQPPIVWKDVAIKGLQRSALDTISAVPSSGLIKFKN